MDEGASTAFSLASRPMKFALSFAVFYCTFYLGLFMTCIGPALNDFVLKFDSTTDEVGTVGNISFAAYLMGALLGGIVYNFVNRQIIVVFLLAAASACLFLFPHVNTLGLFFLLAGIMGFCGGAYDTAQVAWIIDIWRHEAGPFILTQHFAWSVGALVTPVLFAPFLTGDLPATEEPQRTTEGAISSSTDQSTTPAAPSAELFVPFTVAGCLGLVSVLVQIVLYIVFQRMKKAQAKNTNDSSNNNDDRDGKNDSNLEAKSQSQDPESLAQKTSLLQGLRNQVRLLRPSLFIVVLACCFAGFDQAMEQCTALFLPTFATKTLGISDQDGTIVLLWFNIGSAVGRAVGIVVVLKILPQYIMAVNFTLVLIGITVLLTLGSWSLTWMWVGNICLGLGFSTLYPAFYAYLEKHLFVGDTIAAILVVSGGLISTLYPLIVKEYVDENPKILTYMNYVGFAVTIVSFGILFRVTRSKKKSSKEQQD